MDWFEWQGQRQLRRNARRLLKNYKLANGIIDKSDYIIEENNEYTDIINTLTEEDVSAMELKFYPIIPNVVNTLCNEFAKRNTKLTFTSVDDVSYNEMLEQKRQQIEESLIAQEQVKMISTMIEKGVIQDQDSFAKAQEQLSEDNIKSLPQIQEFFDKNYINIVEEWAQHQQEADDGRFRLEELEERGFKDLLIADGNWVGILKSAY